MPEPRDPRSILESAEETAADGNYAAAEELLREAALLQEASLGPLHPDLANTLNNLGVVCERTGNLVAAEDCFRRAFAIATAVLSQDHSFVATSRNNLRDFCEANGKPFDLPASPPAVIGESAPDPPSESQLPAPSSVELPLPDESQLPSQTQPSSELQDTPHAQRRTLGPLVIAIVTAGMTLMLFLTAARPWFSESQRPRPSAEIASAPTREVAARPLPPSSREPIPAPTNTTKLVERAATNVGPSRIEATSTTERTTLVKARLCAELDEWRCDPADRPVPPGPLFFYTQVKSRTDTRVTHRWYRGEGLYQSIELRVQASPGVGYRTFSRQTMNGESAGRWRVELRSEDGTLLHEERFAVR